MQRKTKIVSVVLFTIATHAFAYWDPDGRDPAFSAIGIFGNLTAQQHIAASRAAAPATVAIGVGIFTGGSSAAWLASQGARTPFVMLGSGIVGGGAGDLAGQAVQYGLGDRNSISLQQAAFSSLLGGGLNCGVNRVFAPRLMTGRIGIREVGTLGKAQADQALGTSVQGRQVQLRTPEGNPIADFVVRDPSTPSGVRVIDVKTGNSPPTYAQEWGYPQVETGNAVPSGRNAPALGLPAGETMPPTPVNFWQYERYELLPFGPEAGPAIGASASAFGSQLLDDGRILQVDATGKHIKKR